MWIPSHIGNKPNRSGCDLLLSNEDWQFEKPLLSVKIKGRNAKKEADPMTIFKELPRDEQLILIADAYNQNQEIKHMEKRFSMSHTTLYKFINEAHDRGLIPTLRGKDHAGKKAEEKKEQRAVTIEHFDKAIAEKEGQAQELLETAERLKQARIIAAAIGELFGAEGQDLITTVFERTSPA